MGARHWPSAIERFWDNVSPEPNTGCWLWLGIERPNGYCEIHLNGKNISAHRFAYEHFKGPLPSDYGRSGGYKLAIDHVCRVKCCVNPVHLELVPQQVNVLRGDSPKLFRENVMHLGWPSGRRALVKWRTDRKAILHCNKGHPYPTKGRRRCRICENAAERARYHKKKG